MRKQTILWKLSSTGGILLYAALNYFQWLTENSAGTFHPSKTPSNQYEHLVHYGVFHLSYLVLTAGIISLWFSSFNKAKTTFLIHLSLLLLAGGTAVLFKNGLLLPLSGDFTNILINDVLQKPLYPLLLLLFFIIDDKKSSL